MLTNVAIYWLTNTVGSSARLYYEDAHAPTPRPGRRRCRSALANFQNDFKSIRRFAERDHSNIVSWNEYDRGSHYSPHDAPDLLIDDIREFFRDLR